MNIRRLFLLTMTFILIIPSSHGMSENNDNNYVLNQENEDNWIFTVTSDPRSVYDNHHYFVEGFIVNENGEAFKMSDDPYDFWYDRFQLEIFWHNDTSGEIYNVTEKHRTDTFYYCYQDNCGDESLYGYFHFSLYYDEENEEIYDYGYHEVHIKYKPLSLIWTHNFTRIEWPVIFMTKSAPDDVILNSADWILNGSITDKEGVPFNELRIDNFVLVDLDDLNNTAKTKTLIDEHILSLDYDNTNGDMLIRLKIKSDASPTFARFKLSFNISLIGSDGYSNFIPVFYEIERRGGIGVVPLEYYPQELNGFQFMISAFVLIILPKLKRRFE